jgi:hypothetical protein
MVKSFLLKWKMVTRNGGEFFPGKGYGQIMILNDTGFNRHHERKQYNVDVIFYHNKKAYSGSIKNISLGGAFIATSSVNQFYSGDTVTLSIPFTDGKKNVKRKGRIQWLNDEGFALEFI